MKFSDIPSVFDLVQILASRGIFDAVISPGSRNAPISISLHRHPEINTYVIPDERVAAFYALGMAQQKQKPVVLCCTSGSAALNYAPAIAEAYYQRVPLLVITADRPQEWIDQGDGQTIRQKEVYRNYISFSTMLIQNAFEENDRAINRQRILEAIEKTTHPVFGPVHLNFPLNEPLYNSREYAEDEFPVLPQLKPEPASPFAHDEVMLQELKSANKILILTAILAPDPQLGKVLEQWAEADQVMVLTETISNLNHPRFFPCIDRLIITFDQEDIEQFQPDLLITFGHQIISKKIKALLRKHPPQHHWHIDPGHPHPNTFQALTKSIFYQPVDVLQALQPNLPTKNSTYQSYFRERDQLIDTAHEDYLKSCPFSDLKAAEMLFDRIPTNWNFHLGNSASVRYAQLFKQGRVLHCNSNRGTSGIDGCTSTALGAAEATGKPTLLLTGDMAFLYDSNAFWHPHVPGNLKIIVVNNAGGGVFRIIDGPGVEEETEKYFEAHHQHTAGQVAVRYQLPYLSARTEAELETGLDTLLHSKNDRPMILEVFTPRLENSDILKKYFHHLQSARHKAKPKKDA